MNERKPTAILPQEVVNAFTAAALTALQELIQVEAFADPDPHNLLATYSETLVSASLTLIRSIPGTMSLVQTEKTASRLAALYLPAGTALSREMVDDVVGEFANVIAGQAKTVLKGTPHHYTISTPAVTRAPSVHQLSIAAAESLAVSLQSNLGRILLFVNLP
jgi:chemotaxis protein CheX